jgi:hypothetical protein
MTGDFYIKPLSVNALHDSLVNTAVILEVQAKSLMISYWGCSS